jgi:hypothetical protein
VYVPVGNRSVRQAVPVAGWFWVDPRLFPPPEDDSAWATRAVLGEELWTTSLPRYDVAMALTVLSGLSFAAALAAAFRRRPAQLAAFGAAAFALTMVYLDQMVTRYEQEKSR